MFAIGNLPFSIVLEGSELIGIIECNDDFIDRFVYPELEENSRKERVASSYNEKLRSREKIQQCINTINKYVKENEELLETFKMKYGIDLKELGV